MAGPVVIVEHLNRHHDGKVGYVVYRCTYGDEQRWLQFMTRLTTYIKHSLREYEEDDCLIDAEDNEAARILQDRFAWEVQEDEAEFNGASMSKVRAHFKNWATAVVGVSGLTKYIHCIYADEEVVDAVLAGGSGEDERKKATAYVKLLDIQFKDQPRQFAAAMVPDDAQRAKLNAGDEGYPPVGTEGCRRYDVGWIKMSAICLMPRAYSVLMKDGWVGYYQRPPNMTHG